MEIRQLAYFVAIAETLHFSRVAEALGLAPSALSMQIQRLERELGVRLLERTKRSVSLTSAGRLFLEEARAALSQVENAKRVAHRAGRGEAGSIRLGYVISAASSGIVQAILRRFRDLAPGVSISLEELSSPAQLQMLEQGKLDVCIVRTLVGAPDQVQRFSLGSEIAGSNSTALFRRTGRCSSAQAGHCGPQYSSTVFLTNRQACRIIRSCPPSAASSSSSWPGPCSGP